MLTLPCTQIKVSGIDHFTNPHFSNCYTPVYKCATAKHCISNKEFHVNVMFAFLRERDACVDCGGLAGICMCVTQYSTTAYLIYSCFIKPSVKLYKKGDGDEGGRGAEEEEEEKREGMRENDLGSNCSLLKWIFT